MWGEGSPPSTLQDIRNRCPSRSGPHIAFVLYNRWVSTVISGVRGGTITRKLRCVARELAEENREKNSVKKKWVSKLKNVKEKYFPSKHFRFLLVFVSFRSLENFPFKAPLFVIVVFVFEFVSFFKFLIEELRKTSKLF